MSTRIAHANIRITDPARSLAFYRALGLDISGCLHMSDGYYLLYLAGPDDPDTTIELVVNEVAGPDYERHPGSGHLALAVGDLDACLARCAAAGVTPEAPPFHPAGRPDLRVCFVVDPDGVRVELIDGAFPTPQDAVPPQLLS